jgi:aspartyl-tRNA(Asn)/glutamyl-tRNA(Gln) amidotransferase subunit A
MSASQHDLAACTATELLRLYRAGEASPVEATEAVLARIADVDRVLNAFCIVDASGRFCSNASSSRDSSRLRYRGASWTGFGPV